MKRTIGVDDTLQERVDSAIKELKDLFLDHLNENPETDTCPDVQDLDDDGRIHEIADSSVPVYNYEIEATWFLHKSELEEAYENHGLGDLPKRVWDKINELVPPEIVARGDVNIRCYLESF